MTVAADTPDAIDRGLIRATQAGLPLVPHPYAALADTLGVAEADVIARLARMIETGRIRRIGAVPNHYACGMVANGMTVWDVDDRQLARLGPLVGALDFVSHCYERPRRLPQWPYNLFAMVHGADRNEVAGKAAHIRDLLGDACRSGDTLYSSEILKKTGLRFGA
jgi:DNA-binding Lrp family transcriptional regulator